MNKCFGWCFKNFTIKWKKKCECGNSICYGDLCYRTNFLSKKN